MNTQHCNPVTEPRGLPAVLVISADAPVREALANALRSEKHHALEAGNARQALETLAGQPVRLALVDVNGGRREDWEVVRTLTTAHPGLRLILLTATEPADHPLAGRAHAWFQKPLLDLRALLAKVVELTTPTEWPTPGPAGRPNCLETERVQPRHAQFGSASSS